MDTYYEMNKSNGGAAKALKSAPTQPQPQPAKGTGQAKPRTLPPSPKVRCVKGC